MFPYSSHLKNTNRSIHMLLYLCFEFDYFDAIILISFFNMIDEFLKRRHAKRIEIIDNPIFNICGNPMTSIHIRRFQVINE